MFQKQNSDGYGTLLEGIEQKTLVYGENTSLSEFHLKKGSLVPMHAHPHEQTGYLVKGHIRFVVEGGTFDAFPGDSWCIPGGVEHSAEIMEDSVAVEVFSPVREDYIK